MTADAGEKDTTSCNTFPHAHWSDETSTAGYINAGTLAASERKYSLLHLPLFLGHAKVLNYSI